jgi:chromosomal replication initiation ATPase DnaA
VADDEGTVADPSGPTCAPAGAALPERFMAAMAAAIGPAQAHSWLKNVSLERIEDEWVLLAGTRFSAHWIRSHLDNGLRQAAAAVALPGPPDVRVRPHPSVQA